MPESCPQCRQTVEFIEPIFATITPIMMMTTMIVPNTLPTSA
jgi:hypothetical protein